MKKLRLVGSYPSLAACLLVLALGGLGCAPKQPVEPGVAPPAAAGGRSAAQDGAPGLSPAVTEPAITAPKAEPHPPEKPEAGEKPEITPQPEPSSGDLYIALDRAYREYRIGLELVVAGDVEVGERRIEEALQRLRENAAKCALSEGCDINRFTDAYTRLLNEQNNEIKNHLARLEELEFLVEIPDEPAREPGTTPFVSTMPEIARTGSLLRGRDLRDIIEINGPVRAALDDWLTWMRPLLMESYENYQYLRPKIAPVFTEAGFPEALLFAIIATETGGKVHAYSHAGAAGPMQFMRHTARRYGLGMDDGFDMRLDPEAATRAGVAYLNDQLAALNDSLEKALAAYNGGENRMRGLNRRLKDINFWDSSMYNRLPQETREYVPRALAAAWLFLHPEEFDLQFPEYDAEITTLTVEQEISISELTVCLGQDHPHSKGWFRILRNLNPRLSPGERVKAGEEIRIPSALASAYKEKCISGDLLESARLLHDANYPDMITYIVVPGDTLGTIATKFRCASASQIAAINNIRPPRYLIRIGQRLQIPACK